MIVSTIGKTIKGMTKTRKDNKWNAKSDPASHSSEQVAMDDDDSGDCGGIGPVM